MTDLTKAKSKSRFWTWVLWAVGIRTASSDSEYGEKLTNYRKWSTTPVIIMSMGVFVLIAIKLTIAMTAFFEAFNALNPESVVSQHDLGTPVLQIVMSSMSGVLTAVVSSIPLWVELPLIILWLLAFVVDFIVAASLANNKKLWWKRHWGGVVTALVTIP